MTEKDLCRLKGNVRVAVAPLLVATYVSASLLWLASPVTGTATFRDSILLVICLGSIECSIAGLDRPPQRAIKPQRLETFEAALEFRFGFDCGEVASKAHQRQQSKISLRECAESVSPRSPPTTNSIRNKAVSNP
jgi:hypothetical protein